MSKKRKAVARVRCAIYTRKSTDENLDTVQSALARATQLVTETGYHLRDADLLILEGRLLSRKDDKKAARTKLKAAIKEARREEKDGCVYKPALDQATRLLQSLHASPPPVS